MKRSSLLCAALCVLTLTSACGSTSFVTAANAKHTVSLSSLVRGPDAELLGPEQLKKVGDFKMAYKSCRMLWTLVPVWNANKDISDEINRQIAAAKAEAIVNLRVESGAMFWTVFTIFGVLPDCGSVKIYGDLVVRTAAEAPTAAAAIAPQSRVAATREYE